jgi:hypothetical protein
MFFKTFQLFKNNSYLFFFTGVMVLHWNCVLLQSILGEIRIVGISYCIDLLLKWAEFGFIFRVCYYNSKFKNVYAYYSTIST